MFNNVQSKRSEYLRDGDVVESRIRSRGELSELCNL